MPCVYILTNKRHGTLYIGRAQNITHRLNQHRTGKGSKFTARHKLVRLVYLEEFAELKDAQAREHQLKNWHRDWKLNLIERENSEWQDLASLLTT